MVYIVYIPLMKYIYVCLFEGVERHFQQYFCYIQAVSFIDEGNWSTRRKSLTCSKSLPNFITYCYIEYTSTRAGFELATLVVMFTDCINNCKSNYHMITITTLPKSYTSIIEFNILNINVHPLNLILQYILKDYFEVLVPLSQAVFSPYPPLQHRLAVYTSL